MDQGHERPVFLQDGDLIDVCFLPGHFPADPELIKTFFPGRVANVDGDKWIGIKCSTEEWQDFIQFAEFAIKKDPNPVGTREALALVEAFKKAYANFQAQMRKSPFKSAMDLAATVA